MKKVLVYLLVVAMAFTSFSLMSVFAEDDLITGSNNVSNWSGWVDYQGGYRTSSEAELSDGTTGTVVEIGVAESGSFEYGALNNSYALTGLEPNETYVLSATVKVTAPAASYNRSGNCVGVWGNGIGLGMKFGDVWQSKCFEQKYDGQWITYQIGINTPEDVDPETKYSVALGTINGENYAYTGIVVLIENVSLVKFNAGNNLLGLNGTPALATVLSNSGSIELNKWSGWVDYQGGYRKLSNDADKGVVIEVGNGSETYSAFCNSIGLKGFEPSKYYLCTLDIKLTAGGGYSSGNALALNGGYIGAGIDFGDGFQGIYFKEANDGIWATYQFAIATSEEVSADTQYNFSVGAVNSQYVAENTQLLIGETSITEIVIPESDEDDLLAASGLGNPAYMLANSINISAETWVGHEDWNHNQGWDGFTDSRTTRSIVSDTLPDGSNGWVILIDASNGGGSETAIENIDKICGFEAGKSYVAVIEYKTDHAWCNGHELCFGFGKNCTHNDQTFIKDGEWHTLITPVLEYTDAMAGTLSEEENTITGYGHYLYMGACENWWSTGDYLKIASVKVYELKDIPEVEGNLITDGAVENADTYRTPWDSGWVDPADSASFSTESHTMDGTGSIKLESKTLNMHFSRKIALEKDHIYKYSGWMKVSENYACTCAGATGAFMSITPSGGSWGNRAGMALDSNANNSTDWTYFEGTFTADETKDYLFALAMWGTSQPESGTSAVWFDELAVVDITPDPIPETEGNLIEKEPAAFAEGTTVTNGWGDSATAETGLSDESRTNDGTKSAKIKMTEKKHQILNVATVSLTGGHVYKFSGWIKTDAEFATAGNGGEGVTLTWGNDMPSTGWITGPTDWTYVEGEFTPAADGEYNLQFRIWGATSEAWVDEVAVVDVTVYAESVSLDETELNLEIGGEATLVATVLPDDTTDPTVTWSSSDESVATVDENGKVTAIGEGTADITAVCGNASAKCTVTVASIDNPGTGDTTISVAVLTLAVLAAACFVLFSKKREF